MKSLNISLIFYNAHDSYNNYQTKLICYLSLKISSHNKDSKLNALLKIELEFTNNID